MSNFLFPSAKFAYGCIKSLFLCQISSFSVSFLWSGILLLIEKQKKIRYSFDDDCFQAPQMLQRLSFLLVSIFCTKSRKWIFLSSEMEMRPWIHSWRLYPVKKRRGLFFFFFHENERGKILLKLIENDASSCCWSLMEMLRSFFLGAGCAQIRHG